MSIKLDTLGIDQLTIAEKLDLIEQIWDSLPEEMSPDEVPDWHIPILKERLAHLKANPNSGRPFRDVLARFGVTE